MLVIELFTLLIILIPPLPEPPLTYTPLSVEVMFPLFIRCVPGKDNCTPGELTTVMSVSLVNVIFEAPRLCIFEVGLVRVVSVVMVSAVAFCETNAPIELKRMKEKRENLERIRKDFMVNIKEF